MIWIKFFTQTKKGRPKATPFHTEL